MAQAAAEKGVKKLDTKTLTGRYDMKQLIKVQQVEQWFMDQLVTLYGVEDEDQLPIPFDFLELLDTDKEDREDLLKDKLADCPGDPGEAITECLRKLDALHVDG